MLRAMDVIEGLRTTGRLSRLVRERATFTARQLWPGMTVGRYRVRDSGVVVHVRHHTADVNVFEQAFDEGQTNLPAPVLDALRGRSEPLNVVDLGANIGMFTAYVLGVFPDARITAFEPDATNAAVLRRTAQANAPAAVEVVEAAAATHDGEVRFSTGNFATSRVEVDGSGIAVLALDVFPRLQGADLVKIDVEGAEWALLADERFARIDATAIGVEYHAHLAPAGDPAQIVRDRLGAMGYEARDEPIKSAPGHGMVWAWKKSA